MTDESFLRTIQETPDDDTTRLVYADWLEEQGDGLGQMKAEYIRLDCQLAALPKKTKGRSELKQKRQRLEERFDPAWTLAVSKGGLSPRQIWRIGWSGNHLFHTTFSPNSRLYLAGGDSGTLRVWGLSSRRRIVELPVYFGLITPDNKQVVGHRGEQTVFIYDLTGKELRHWEVSEPVVYMAIAPNGQHIACGHADKTIRLWDLTTGQEVRKFEGHTEPASVAFSPSGKRLLSASVDRTVRLWDVETGEQTHSFDEFKGVTPIPGHGLIIQAMFAGEGQLAGYVWAEEKTLVTWDAATGKKTGQLDLGADHHKDVAIRQDGRWLLTGHEDRTVRLRDLKTGEELHRFQMADIYVPRGLSFSPDGRYAVAGSHRSWLYLWGLRE